MSAGGAGDGEADDLSREERETPEPAIDIVLLARKVYELMRTELRLERARGAGIER